MGWRPIAGTVLAAMILITTACSSRNPIGSTACEFCHSMLSPSAKACPKCGEPTSVADVVTNSIGIQLVPIAAGRFRMGAGEGDSSAGDEEKPPHNVDISTPFMAGITEVTQEQFEAVMGSNPSAFAPGGEQADRVRGIATGSFPVESVTWDEAVEFCRRLSDTPQEKSRGRSYRLPTEAEWELAATRGGNRTGRRGASRPSDQHVHRRPHEVDQGVSNRIGLIGMTDNVSEWTSDWFSSEYYITSTGRDPQGTKDGSVRSFRGGAWNSEPTNQRLTARDADVPDARRADLGFRVVCVEGADTASLSSSPERTQVINRPTPAPAAEAGIPLESWKRAVVRLAVRTMTGDGEGSGFLIDSRGTIVTNLHVIDDALEVTAYFSDGFQEPVAGWLSIATAKDLAFLQLKSTTSRCDPLALAGSLPRDGQKVYALGCPLGLGFSLTDGIVSGIRSPAELRDAFRGDGLRGPDLNVHWVQTTAAINWGNSGGPLIDDKGNVVGVNTLVFGRSREGGKAEGLNFAVSSLDVLQAQSEPGGSLRPFPIRD